MRALAVTLAAVSVALLETPTIAMAGPARRAARMQVVEALRRE